MAAKEVAMQDDTGLNAGSALRSLLKLVVLGGLGLVLLIPVAQLLGLVRERRERQEEVRRELAALWGGEQTVGAVVVAVPLKSSGAAREWLCFLPAEVRWQGTLQPESRRRGIFEVTLYEAKLTATGWFRRPDPSLLGVAAERVDWDAAVAVLAVSDPRGLSGRPVLRWQGRERTVLPGVGPVAGARGGVQAPLGAGALAAEQIPFGVDLVLRGSEQLRVLPLGELTHAELAARWADPGFVGAPLPTSRQVGADGFRAIWDVPYYGRGFAQQWRSGEVQPERFWEDPTTGGAFGVSLVRPANPYQQTERAVKYAVLFIALTFTTVFLLELLSPVRLHPIHYLLVGFALCLFYLLLLALAEHLGLGAAYAIAAGAVVALVTLYARSVLAGRGRAAVLGAALASLYGWLYTLLRAEDYSLLLGACGLFAVLAAVMFLTRRLDWATLRYRPAPGLG
jgi:inner membrane protein